MAQKKNSVQLSNTEIARLQKLVDTGEYCSLDDAASHIIVSVLGSTRQYSEVLIENQPVVTKTSPIQNGTQPVPAKTSGKPRTPIEGF